MAEFPTYEQMAKNVAEKALDEFLYNGKSIREWMQIITSEDAISRQTVLDYIYNDLGLGDEENGKDLERQMELERSYKYVKSLPPVKPSTGHWITEIKSDLRGDMWPTNPKCSKCGGEPYYSNTIYNYKFCPYCGCVMKGELE